MSTEVSSSMFPRSEMLAFFYVLLDQGAPPGLVKACMLESHRRAHSQDVGDAMDDAHLSGMAGQLTRQLMKVSSEPVVHERLSVLMDLEEADCSYESLVLHMDEIVEEAAAQVRKALTARIREHHREGTHGDLPIIGEHHINVPEDPVASVEEPEDDEEHRLRSYSRFQSSTV